MEVKEKVEGRAMMGGIVESDWTGCYDGSWKGVITPESFAHP
jgi:hypothetical protein